MPTTSRQRAPSANVETERRNTLRLLRPTAKPLELPPSRRPLAPNPYVRRCGLGPGLFEAVLNMLAFTGIFHGKRVLTMHEMIAVTVIGLCVVGLCAAVLLLWLKVLMDESDSQLHRAGREETTPVVLAGGGAYVGSDSFSGGAHGGCDHSC